MERIKGLLRAGCTALTAALMAGCAACLIVGAPGFAISPIPVYLLALAAALIVHAGRRGTAWAIGAMAALALSMGLLLAAYLPEITQAFRDIAASGIEGGIAAHAAAGMGAALILALLLGALFSGLLRSAACVPFALLVLLAAVICALAVNEDISLWAALPGLAAGVAAFGIPGDGRREGVRPVLLVPALALTILALVLVPAGRNTWEPLEQLAERIRSVVEDYVRFTEERVAFSINEKGYDHAGMIDDTVVAMLGGPAEPDDEPVMRVASDANMLLRGTIKRSYTGYSWVDDQPKARYLYYDFTHRGVRGDVFDDDTSEGSEGFVLKRADVEMLSGGTSTLFVPSQLAEFDMGLADAVYYNSAGELFLTRKVEAGDAYSFSARLPESEQALISAAASAMQAQDKRYARMLEDYTALPGGIDSRVYALTVELTSGTNNPAEKAFAIQNHLAQNYGYTLQGGYPELGRDFVSWFLLESKEGYCSYFASSMAVMCRIAGLPARYVEGYYVQAAPGGETIVTGLNAHAWVEVYLNGLGWVSFDPTARAVQHQQGQGGGGYMQDQTDASGNDGGGHDGENIPDDAPTPTPTPDIGSSPDPTPTPDTGMEDPGNDAPDEPDETPVPDENRASDPPDSDNDAPENDDSSLAWLWILLAALLLIAAAALACLWLRRRLAATDPLKLCASTRSSQMAAIILYRGMLTLLAQIGLVPMNGETPEHFAQRACLSIENPRYMDFVSDVVQSRYSGRNVGRDTLEAGRMAYVVFLNGMRRGERLRFHIRRVLHGLGSFESIP